MHHEVIMRASIRAGVATGIVAALSATASAAHAQTAKECDQAAKVISTGRVNANQQSVYVTITRCGAVGANAFATGIPKNASETDTVRLDEYMGAADNWRDASIYNAATQLANQSTATVQARVFAIRHLIGLLQRNTRFSYGAMVATADTTLPNGTRRVSMGCQGYMISEPSGTVVGAPLPSGVETQIRSTLASLAAGHLSAPKQVRAAAACLLE
jgi:hypothetical protein